MLVFSQEGRRHRSRVLGFRGFRVSGRGARFQDAFRLFGFAPPPPPPELKFGPSGRAAVPIHGSSMILGRTKTAAG